MPDVFIGTHLEERSKLGGMWSLEFEIHKLVCEEHWAKLGLPEPFTDAPYFRFEKYMTFNARKKLRI